MIDLDHDLHRPEPPNIQKSQIRKAPGGLFFWSQPMDQVSAANLDVPMDNVPRCGAKDRAGMRCQTAPMKDRKRCRVHGGLSPGAPRGQKNGNYKDGHWTKEAVEERRFIRSLLKAGPAL
jgi:hypothetical protein